MITEEIYQKAVQTYGPESQTMMAVEECAEFLNALAKFKRGRATFSDIVDEIADVTIMMEQMALIFGKSEVKQRIEYKTQRLKRRLDAIENE